MYSIGVDIGTSTTEIIVSQLEVSVQLGASLLPETKLEKIEVIYKSPVIFTPLITKDRIHFEAIKMHVKECLKQSGITKEKIETGAVIITGETARKENAALVAENLSEYLGDFVVASAGPDLEAILAAQGAGVKELSKQMCKKIWNLDIGGGTLNAALFDSGDCVDTYAMDIGGRLITFDEEQNITYLSKRILDIIDKLNLQIKENEVVTRKELIVLCQYLAKNCINSVFDSKEDSWNKPLYLTRKKTDIADVDYITISGGVGEYVKEENAKFIDEDKAYWEVAKKYGDIGPLLGLEIRKQMDSFPGKLYFPKEKIRATVIGAGSCSLSISGSTVGFDESILPIKNIPIVKPNVFVKDWSNFYTRAKPCMDRYEEDIKAIFIMGTKSPSYKELKILALELDKLYKDSDKPMILLMKEDFAKALSQLIKIYTTFKGPVICLDKIDVKTGDYIDIGRPIGNALPVVIKTLIYET